MNGPTSNLLTQFECLEISAPDFRHSDHLQVAYEMLDKYDFVDSCSLYARTIRAMAESVGVPEKYNATITFAFMSLVAERKGQSINPDFDSFLAANPDLLDKNLLHSWYSRERLGSTAARRQFLLPDQVGRA